MLTVTSGELGPVTLTVRPDASTVPVPLVKPCPNSQISQIAFGQSEVVAPDLET